MSNLLDFQRLSNFVSGIVDRKIYAVSMSITSGTGYLQGLVTSAQQYATTALGHATTASTAAATADTAAATTLIVWNQFTSTYVGLNNTDPTISSQGNSINIGAFYIRRTDGRIRYVSAVTSGGVPVWNDASVTADPTTAAEAGNGIFLSLLTLNSQTVKSPVVFQNVITSPRVSNWTSQQVATAIDVNDRITTVNNSITSETTRATAAETTLTSTKVSKSGDTLTGFITVHATCTANFHIAPKIYVDNTVAAAPFVPLSGNVLMTGLFRLSGSPTLADHPTTKAYADALVTASALLTKIKTVHGIGSGLDADLLDGYGGLYYMDIPARLGYTPLNRAGDTLTGFLTLHAGPTSAMHPATKAYVDAAALSATIGYTAVNIAGDTMTGMLTLFGAPTSPNHATTKAYTEALVTASALLTKIKTVHGAASGLDADLLDGQEGVYYSNIPARLGYTPLNRGGDTLTGFLILNADPISPLHPTSKQYTDALVAAPALLAKIKTVQGPGSGLDADLLGGQYGVYYARPGKIEIFAMSSAPAGYLACDGTAVSRTTYSALFAAIGTTYGNGNGSTTFNLPDCRGEFIRGWDNGRGVDAGRGIGSFQNHLLASHSHTGTTDSTGSHSHDLNGGWSMAQFGYDGGDYKNAAGRSVSPNTGSAGLHNHALTIDSTGGAETRPRNIAFLICIKF